MDARVFDLQLEEVKLLVKRGTIKFWFQTN